MRCIRRWGCAWVSVWAMLPVLGAGERVPAPDAMQVLVAEIRHGLAERGRQDAFDRYLAWMSKRLDDSEGEKTWDDKTGNCRLEWVDALLRDPLWALPEGERFTRQLYQHANDRNHGLTALLRVAAQKLDVPGASEETTPLGTIDKPPAGRAIDAVADTIRRTREALEEAFAPLSDEQRATLDEHLYPVSTGDVEYGPVFADKDLGRTVCDAVVAMDRAALHRAAGHVARLAHPAFLDELRRYTPAKETQPVELPGVEGRLHERVETTAGDILVGGLEANVYHLDRLAGVAAVVDLGGNDTYIEGATGPDRPVLVLLDLAGDDTYRGTSPGIQGGAVLGVSLLVDDAGNDTYDAEDVAHGSCLAGAGILIDSAGNDAYRGKRRVQGTAMGGVGLLVDRGGNDSYRAALLSQGVGGALGLGLLADLAGDNQFYAGGLYPNTYGDSAGYGGWSQGIGAGPRGTANGGIGVLLAGPGNDVYECDYFSHGGGYWFAAGFARDFGGDDRRLGSTRTAFDGGEREERRFLRWGVAWQAHYGTGMVLDDAGNDRYHADHAGPGFSWDLGLAALVDLAGNDDYHNPNGQGAEAGFGVICDAAGDDTYRGGPKGLAREKINYHPTPQAGANFGFLIDYGGANDFGEEIFSHGSHRRGSKSGFLVLRPEMPEPASFDIPSRQATPSTPSDQDKGADP